MDSADNQLVAFSDADARLQAVVNVSLEGVLIVDGDGRVRFVNPVAAALLHRRAEDLIGRIFGLPFMVGEVAEIGLLRPSGNLLITEMRTAAITWHGEPAQLIVLRDVTKQRRAEEALRDAEGFSRTILNSLAQRIAVLDDQGVVVMVNDAWHQFAVAHGDEQLRKTGVGVNYFDVCLTATGVGSQYAPGVLQGMRDVLNGELPFFDHEYSADSPDEERWFHMRAVPLHGQRRGLVISHTDITDQRRHGWAVAEANALREQLQARERELLAVSTISGTGRSVARTQRAESVLRVDSPAIFLDCVEQYSALLDAAIEARSFDTAPNIQVSARALAVRLGEQHAVARDVVEIHLAALRSRSIDASPSRQQAYLEDGRVLALQLMGYLVTYYRDGVVV
ncbi:PAS domain-containing protein [Oscillochloris sp. ZM17-4]|uniref:PAS domain-containing protein n=1 Tax=Oscillochloris sp. ZM17-4 TaxID=2866714 RepID=UPI001C72CE80|nr:PAS domain-containing protein [Oscillochloris sp. ZM17-4]MBX0326736.1 PAS domain-containing protein [Oscillochloris sp. ZM17-4]